MGQRMTLASSIFFLSHVDDAIAFLSKVKRSPGFFFGLFGCLYGCFRIWLDTLHMQSFRFIGGVIGILIGLAGWTSMILLNKSLSYRQSFHGMSLNRDRSVVSHARGLLKR